MPAIYPLATDLLAREIAPDIRVALRTFLLRVGLKQGIIDKTSIEALVIWITYLPVHCRASHLFVSMNTSLYHI